MRWTIVWMLAACGAGQPRQAVHFVECGGVRVPLPASLHVVQARTGELIAASRDVALAVFEDGPPRAGGRARVVEQISDAERSMYVLAFRDKDRCTFRAVARSPASRDGVAVITAIAGSAEPGLLVGSPRVPEDSALAVLLREVEDHL